ncbi:MAG TPA: hypothetical protein PK122_01390 [Candidatus Paceibacterota bacterium]|nr:hypothetical protein [Candidatus Paceibacterota bacterium]
MADFKYTYQVTDFPNDKYDLDTLLNQTRSSAITVALDYINGNPSYVDFFFKAELDSGNQTILNAVVAAHDGTPDVQEPAIVRADILTEGLKYVKSGDTTQEFFAAKTLLVDVSSGETTKIKDFSWPFPIALKSGTIFVSSAMVGDELEVHVAPNTLVGALIAPLNVGDTSMYVSPTVLENVKRGYYVGLYQPGADGIEISRVISIDTENSALKIYPSDVSANAGSYIAMCSKIIPYLYMSHTEKIEIGKQMPTGQRVPANIPIRVIYKNNNGLDKKVSFFIEYLY